MIRPLMTLLLILLIQSPSHAFMIESDTDKHARVMAIPMNEQQAKIYIDPNNPAPAQIQYVRPRHQPKPFYKKPLFIGGGTFAVLIIGLVGYLILRNKKNS